MSYRDLTVWQKSMDLVIEVYRITDLLPKNEQYGLTSQIRRCSVSIASNIAEGSRRGTDKDYRHFILMSFGSGAEMETQLEIVERLKFVDSTEIAYAKTLLSEVMKMLNKLQQSLFQALP